MQVIGVAPDRHRRHLGGAAGVLGVCAPAKASAGSQSPRTPAAGFDARENRDEHSVVP